MLCWSNVYISVDIWSNFKVLLEILNNTPENAGFSRCEGVQTVSLPVILILSSYSLQLLLYWKDQNIIQDPEDVILVTDFHCKLTQPEGKSISVTFVCLFVCL